MDVLVDLGGLMTLLLLTAVATVGREEEKVFCNRSASRAWFAGDVKMTPVMGRAQAVEIVGATP